MAYISNALRQLVAARAQGLCEYCQTAQTIVIEMELDHIVPEAAGGATEADNLCLACISCNTFKSAYHTFKSAYQTGIDPQTNEEVRLFNPRRQQWDEHFRINQANILGSTIPRALWPPR
jgi:5-methylcytosine-specific restriction endonuclease McrA